MYRIFESNICNKFIVSILDIFVSQSYSRRVRVCQWRLYSINAVCVCARLLRVTESQFNIFLGQGDIKNDMSFVTSQSKTIAFSTGLKQFKGRHLTQRRVQLSSNDRNWVFMKVGGPNNKRSRTELRWRTMSKSSSFILTWTWTCFRVRKIHLQITTDRTKDADGNYI